MKRADAPAVLSYVSTQPPAATVVDAEPATPGTVQPAETSAGQKAQYMQSLLPLHSAAHASASAAVAPAVPATAEEAM